MKTYYIESTVKFKHSDGYNDSENYSFVIESNKKTVIKDAKIQSEKEFKSDMGNSPEILSVVIDDYYETSSDARAN